MTGGRLLSINYKSFDKQRCAMARRTVPQVRHELPAVLSVEASRVRYDPPRRYYAGKELREIREGVEILVRTAEPLPVRAISPVLFIGDTIVGDYEVAGPSLYRFFLFDLALAPGAPIALGWPFAPRRARPTNFTLSIGLQK
jgi:hypothetical protein